MNARMLLDSPQKHITREKVFCFAQPPRQHSVPLPTEQTLQQAFHAEVACLIRPLDHHGWALAFAPLWESKSHWERKPKPERTFLMNVTGITARAYDETVIFRHEVMLRTLSTLRTG